MGTADIQGRSRQVSLPVWLVWMDDSLLVVIRVGVSLVIGPRFPPAGTDARSGSGGPPSPHPAVGNPRNDRSEIQLHGHTSAEGHLDLELLEGLGHLQFTLGHGMGSKEVLDAGGDFGGGE